VLNCKGLKVKSYEYCTVTVLVSKRGRQPHLPIGLFRGNFCSSFPVHVGSRQQSTRRWPKVICKMRTPEHALLVSSLVKSFCVPLAYNCSKVTLRGFKVRAQPTPNCFSTLVIKTSSNKGRPNSPGSLTMLFILPCHCLKQTRLAV
jgi:hypothetical protein